MKVFRYIILALILLNLPEASLKFVGGTLGTLLSYSSLMLLILYYILEKKGKLNVWLIIIGFSYYLISSLNYIGFSNVFIFISIKYFIIIVCGYELMKKNEKNEMFIFLIIGALSIGVHAIFFTSHFGRYSGLYLNPNVAGFVCISGYGLTYGLKNSKAKLIGQFIFSLMGLLTFSRTFIVLWIFLNIISLKISIKNIRIFALGFGILITMLFIDKLVGLNNPRFQQLVAIVNNEQVSSVELNEGSRTDTWSAFYQDIIDKPLFGNGYGTFQGNNGKHTLGVHNTYLLLLGESGIIPFLLFLVYIFYLLYQSLILFDKAPNLLMQSIGLSIFLLANHNFFNFYYITFLAMWIQSQIILIKRNQQNQ